MNLRENILLDEVEGTRGVSQLEESRITRFREVRKTNSGW